MTRLLPPSLPSLVSPPRLLFAAAVAHSFCQPQPRLDAAARFGGKFLPGCALNLTASGPAATLRRSQASLPASRFLRRRLLLL
jgi:hypothetical protein